MLYFDDMAMWLQSRKGKLLRNIICIGILGAATFMGFMSYQDSGKYKAQIEANKITLAETGHQVDAIHKKIEDFVKTDKTFTYSAQLHGPYIAEKQTNYSNIMGSGRVDTVNDGTTATEESLMNYLDNNRSAWYPTPFGSEIQYVWTFLTRTSATVTRIPSVWQCGLKGDVSPELLNLLSVAVADYNATTERFSNVKVHTTYNGYNILNNISVSNISAYDRVGSIIPVECNENLGGRYSSYYSKFADAVIKGDYSILKETNDAGGKN